MAIPRVTFAVCCAVLATGVSTVALGGSEGSHKPAFAKPPAKPADSAPMPGSTNVGRGFGGAHTQRPFSSLGSGRPLAPIGHDRGLTRIGTDRPLAPIGGGGPDASGPVPTTEPKYPGYHGGGRTFIAVEPRPKSDAGLEIEGEHPAGSVPSVEPTLPGEPGLEPTPAEIRVAEPTIDPIKLEMAQRLRAEGHVQFLRGEFHLAEASLQSSVDLVPELNDARFELAFALLANGRVNSAAREFVRAEAHDPTVFKSTLDARAAVGSQETFDLCRQQADRYHAAYPMDSDALFVHALMQWWSGKGRDAGIDLAALAGADPAYGGLKAAFVNPALDEALKPQ
ncbi:MAG: hypothetical protein IPH13_13540 [Planctomycetes bacterium]|nr:hypothetical protein [Planctomycetota bacterium]MCC7172000.1 hypothetical protein [Planctomycetota bacterium]